MATEIPLKVSYCQRTALYLSCPVIILSPHFHLKEMCGYYKLCHVRRHPLLQTLPSQQAGFSEPGPEGPVAQQERGVLGEIKIRSALHPTGRSPLSPLMKVTQSRTVFCFYSAIFVWSWNENARTRQKQQTNENRAIWLVCRTDTNAGGFWLVKRTLGWKNFMPKNFLEINRYFALTSYYNTIDQSNNAFSILGFSLAGKRRVHVLIFSSTGW